MLDDAENSPRSFQVGLLQREYGIEGVAGWLKIGSGVMAVQEAPQRQLLHCHCRFSIRPPPPSDPELGQLVKTITLTLSWPMQLPKAVKFLASESFLASLWTLLPVTRQDWLITLQEERCFGSLWPPRLRRRGVRDSISLAAFTDREEA
jgi:hypothetical protein